jgi:hypothetical protein
MNFQFYNVDQDWVAANTAAGKITAVKTTYTGKEDIIQDHGWYFGVDEAELALNVSGTADNGLNYGFKVEIQVNTSDGTTADEARLQFSGGWGTLQMGDEDGAEDIMNYGGENLMGAVGGFDGDFDDVLLRAPAVSAKSFPTIEGDTSDATKISYFSPRFSGFQVGASLTPTPNTGDNFKADGGWENHIGVGANYDNSFGGVRVRVSGVYSMNSATDPADEDVGAYSVGGIVGFGPVSVGANWTDNGDVEAAAAPDESSYWNVAASFETGPIYLSAGYFVSTYEYNGGTEDEFSNISLTADYTVAPGLGVYAEVDLIDDDGAGTANDNDATVVILGANVSF